MCACSDANFVHAPDSGHDERCDLPHERPVEDSARDDALKTLRDLCGALQTQCAVLETQNEELQQAHDLLECSRNRYHAFFNAVSAACLSLRPDGTIEDSNEAAVRLLGVARSQLVERTIYRYVAEGHHSAFDSASQAALESGCVQSLDLEALRHDRSTPWVRMDIVPIALPGPVKGRLLVARPVGEIRDVLDEHNVLAAALGHVAQPVVAHSLEGRILLWNGAAQELLGYSADEAADAGLQRLLHDASEHHFAHLARILKGGGSLPERQTSYVHKNGEPVAVVERIVPFFDAADDVKGVVRMLTAADQAHTGLRRKEDSRRWENQSRRIESLSALAGGIAHDYNNLLAAILANLELAGMSIEEGEEAKSYIDQARQVTQQAADLTAHLGTLTGQDGGARAAISLPTLVRDVAGLIQSEYDVLVHIEDPSEEVPLYIAGDLRQARRAVRHVLENAAESYDAGGPIMVRTGRVHLDGDFLASRSLGQDLSPGPYALLRVDDRGRGMDAKTLERAFDPFFSTKFAGRGLGLAAVAGTVRRLNGVVELSSSPNKGTVFCAYVPVAMPYPESSQWMTADLSGIHVLVLDADSVVCSLINEFVGPLSESVQAHTRLDDFVPDPEPSGGAYAALLDASLGRQRLEEARRDLSVSFPGVRFGLASQRDEADLAEAAGAPRPGGTLFKPYSVERLAGFVRSLVGAPR